MTICREKRNGKVYLAEYKSVRQGKKVKHIFVRYLGVEGENGQPVKKPKRTLDKVKRSMTLRSGDIQVMWKLVKELGFIETIDQMCCGEREISGMSPGKLLSIWAVNRAIEPESCVNLPEWVQTTDLPSLSGLTNEHLTDDSFLSALDFICYHDADTNRTIDHSNLIDEMLYQKWRSRNKIPNALPETVAYDMTSMLRLHDNITIL